MKNRTKERLEALENAYKQLIGVLNKKLNLDEVDPEKMKTALSAYRQAADDSQAIFQQILELEGTETTKDEQDSGKDKKEVRTFTGPESRF